MYSCPVCPHRCGMKEGTIGICGARIGKNGVSESMSYGVVTSISLDRIEKKPLARFMPGKRILSVGSFGCNLDCPFCQNYHIAHPETELNRIEVRPEELVKHALFERNNGNVGIAYTYNEPLIGYEFVRDVAALAKEAGLVNVVVSNGFTTDYVLDQVLPLIDAWNLDLKGNATFYQSLQGGLEPAWNTIERASKVSHVEVTTLVIPEKNDDPQEVEALSKRLAAIDPGIVLHLSRFFPARDWGQIPPTDIGKMEELKEIAMRYLDTVLLGNV